MKKLSLLFLLSLLWASPAQLRAMMEEEKDPKEEQSKNQGPLEYSKEQEEKALIDSVGPSRGGRTTELIKVTSSVNSEEPRDQGAQKQFDADTDSDYGENPHDWEDEGNENLSLKDFRRALRKEIHRNAPRLIIIHKSDGKNVIKAVPENPDALIANGIEDREITNLLKELLALEHPSINVEDLCVSDSPLSSEKLKIIFDRIDRAIAEQKKASARILPGSDQEQLASILHNIILKREEKPSSHYAEADKIWVQQQQAWEEKTILEREFKNRAALKKQAKNFSDQVQDAHDKIDLENTMAGRLAHIAEKTAVLCAMVPEPHVQILGEVAAGVAWSADKFNKIWNERDVKAAKAALQEIETALKETSEKLTDADERVGTLKNRAEKQETYARHAEAQRRKTVAETLHPPASRSEADWNSWATQIVTEGKGEPAWIAHLMEGGMADPTWVAEETERAWKKRLIVDEEKIRQQKKEFKEHMRPLNRERYKNNKALQKAQREEQTTQKEFEEQREKHQKLKTELETLGQTQEAFESKYQEVAEAAQELTLKEKAWLEAQERLTHQDTETLTHKNVHAIEKTLILRHLNRSLDQVKIDALAWGYNNQLTSWLAYRLPEHVGEQTPPQPKTGGSIPQPIRLDEELEKLGRRLWAQKKRASSAQTFSLMEHQGGEKKEELLETEKETPLKETAKPPSVAELVASIIIPTQKDRDRWQARKDADERLRERDALFAEKQERRASMSEPKGVRSRLDSITSLFSWSGQSIAGTILGSINLKSEVQKLRRAATQKVTDAEKLWFDLVQEAHAEIGGIPYVDKETINDEEEWKKINDKEIAKHWEQADRAAAKAWEERALLQKEVTLATHIKDEEEWNNDIDRWIAKEEADKLTDLFGKAIALEESLAAQQQSRDPAWQEAYNKAVQEVDRLRPLVKAAKKKWIALANEEESVSMALEERDEAAAEEARKKLEPLDRAAMGLWKKVKEMSPEERSKKRMATFAKEKEAIVTQPATLITSGSERASLTLNDTLKDIEDIFLYKLEADEKAKKEKIEHAAKNYFHDEDAKKVWEEELTFEERHLYNINNEDANEVYKKAAQKKIEEAQSNYDKALEDSKGVFIVSSKQKQAALAELQKAAAHLMKVKAEIKESELARSWGNLSQEKKTAKSKKESDAIEELNQARENIINTTKEFEATFGQAYQEGSSQNWKLAKEAVQTQVKPAYDRLLQAYKQLQEMAPRTVVEATEEERERWVTEIEYARSIEDVLDQRITSARRWQNIGIAGVSTVIVVTSPIWVPVRLIAAGIDWMTPEESMEDRIRRHAYRDERRHAYKYQERQFSGLGMAKY
ncbi:MAG: hypothetical protein K2W99_00505 [Chthoniobacterales bacterium]|nr:hypothetical protein [Chthoniobacterales bacterium]